MNYKWYDVKDLYDYCRENALPLLSTYSSSFWGEYILNYEKYDRMFEHMYKSFRYFNQDPLKQSSIDEVVIDFIDDISDYLLMHEKKYTELFKIQLLNYGNIQYDFYTEQTANTIKNIVGNYKYGSRRDINGIVVGSRLDNGVTNYGSRVDTVDNNYGSQTSSENTEVENKKMAFDSTAYENNSKSITSATTNTGSHNDTERSTRGSYTDTTSNSIGSQSSSNTFDKGEQTDDENRNENENERIYIKGYKENPVKNLEMFRRYWNGYSFYGDIFKDIAKEILLV